jgi:hypothetical protein
VKEKLPRQKQSKEKAQPIMINKEIQHHLFTNPLGQMVSYLWKTINGFVSVVPVLVGSWSPIHST